MVSSGRGGGFPVEHADGFDDWRAALGRAVAVAAAAAAQRVVPSLPSRGAPQAAVAVAAGGRPLAVLGLALGRAWWRRAGGRLAVGDSLRPPMGHRVPVAGLSVGRRPFGVLNSAQGAPLDASQILVVALEHKLQLLLTEMVEAQLFPNILLVNHTLHYRTRLGRTNEVTIIVQSQEHLAHHLLGQSVKGYLLLLLLLLLIVVARAIICLLLLACADPFGREVIQKLENVRL